MSPIPEIPANDLRALAERADSRRGRTVHLVRNPDGSNPAYDVADGDEVNGRQIILNLRTMDAAPQFKPRIASLKLSSEPRLRLARMPDKDINACDALFTSLVALEKFVVPYYARFKPASEVAEMRNAFCTMDNALAIAHIPDSIETEMTVDREHFLGTSLFVLESERVERPGAVFVRGIEAFVAASRR